MAQPTSCAPTVRPQRSADAIPYRRRSTPAAGRRHFFRGNKSERRGVAAVEFAVIAPLFFMLVFGIIEFGRMLMVQQVLTNATREGARAAVVEGATAADVRTTVQNYLQNSSVSGATETITPSNLGNLGFGDPVTVSVTVPFDSISWTGATWFLGGLSLNASSVMQAERLQ